MALTQIDDRGLKTPIDLIDNEKIRLGTGNDLELWHQTGNSYITSTGANLTLRALDHIYLQDIDGNTMADFNDGGAVELYHNGTKKLETSAGGADVTGGFSVTGDVHFNSATNAGKDVYWDESASELQFNDATYATFGTGEDLRIYHDGSNSWIKNSTGVLVAATADFQVASVAGDEQMIRAYDDGAVELYHDNSKKLSTGSGGIVVYGSYYTNDNNKIYLGSDNDLQIYFDGSHSNIINTTGNLYINATASDTAIACKPNGAVELYYDHSKKLETSSTGITVSGNATFGDGVGTVMGASNDFQIYHDNGNGSNTIDGLNHKIELLHSGEKMIVCNPDAGVDLYHNNSKVFETLGNGVRAQGGIMFGSDTADANRLTDYEEGTFTAAIGVDSGTDPSQNAYTHRVAYYKKIGKLVHWKVDIKFGAISQSGSGNAVVMGLPFTSSASSNSFGCTFSAGYNQNWGTDNFPMAGYMNTNDTKINLMNNTISNGNSHCQASGIINGTRLICGGTYMTDS